ncbi:MAG: hypothetical protein ACKVPJ_01190 [Chitinophagales bacterium]
MKKTCSLIFALTMCAIITFAGENNPSAGSKVYKATLLTATDEEYPHNNMIGFKSTQAGKYAHNAIHFTQNASGKFDAVILPGNNISDTIFIKDVNLMEMMPSVPEYVTGDPYLSYLAVMNQEFNRIQVKFTNKNFTALGNGTEESVITRIDIANNCLAKGLWEVIAFTTEDSNDKLYFQCWFDFPEELYNDLFAKRNSTAITKYDKMLTTYYDEKAAKVDLNVLRKVNGESEIAFTNLNHELYPLKGERETKAKNIISPIGYTSINDFLNNDTKFATFASPGQYTKDEPRKTQLSRFQNIQKVMLRTTTSANAAATPTQELQLYFTDNAKTTLTKFIVGGLQLDKLPVLNSSAMHKGWQRPMGIGNHSFYNSIDDINATSSLQNPYFAMLLDANDTWLDSHEIGIDGPLFFRDETDPNKVHMLILSFERHAFVGHFVFEIPKA